MTDTSFTDSYIETDAELEALIGSDPRVAAAALKAAAAATQAWYCQEATRHIDQMPLRGCKYEYDQDLDFPRIIDGVVVGDEDQNAVVPDDVERACMEEAIAIYQAGTDGGLRALQEQGVSAMSIGGKLSYSFVGGASQSGLLSATAKRLLRRYTGAAVR